MTALEELQTFAACLEPFCESNGLRLVILAAEDDLFRAGPLSPRSILALTQLSEQLVCGHLVPTSEGRNLFILVRAPFAASATLLFVTHRTYSLTLLQNRCMAINRFERDLAPPPANPDPWQLLTQATDTVLKAELDGSLFLQPEQSAPLQTKNDHLVAFRSTFSSGSLSGTIASAKDTGDPASQPVTLYLL